MISHASVWFDAVPIDATSDASRQSSEQCLHRHVQADTCTLITSGVTALPRMSSRPWMMRWKYGAKSSFAARARKPIEEMASDCTEGCLVVTRPRCPYATEHRLNSHSTSAGSVFLKIFLLIISTAQNWPTQEAAMACTRRHGLRCTMARLPCITCAPHFFWKVPSNATDTYAMDCRAT